MSPGDTFDEPFRPPKRWPQPRPSRPSRHPDPPVIWAHADFYDHHLPMGHEDVRQPDPPAL